MTDTAQLVPFRVHACYPWFGDGDPEAWMNARLEESKEAGDIQAFHVRGAHHVLHGLHDILFTIDLDLSKASEIQQSERALQILYSIVGEKDVAINRIKPIEENSE